MNTRFLFTCSLLGILLFSTQFYAVYSPSETIDISHNLSSKQITIADTGQKLVLQLDYSAGCKIAQLKIKGKNVLSASGIYTGFTTKAGLFTSCMNLDDIKIAKSGNKILITNILYGDHSINVKESWSFRLAKNKIVWTINRKYNSLAKLEETAFPQWYFADLSVWKGGILDNEGMVWCKYLKNVNDTYGVHTGGVTFWNPDIGNALRITAKSDGKYLATKYSQSDKNEFVCTQFVMDTELEPRYNLNRFVRLKVDVFTPIDVQEGVTKVTLDMEYVDDIASN